MPLPIIAADVALGLGGKILKGAGKAIKGIGKGLKKIFGGNSKKREAKKALRQGFKAEKKIEKFQSKISKQQERLGGAQATQSKSGGILKNLFQTGGADSIETDESFQGTPSLTPADDTLSQIQKSVFPGVSKDSSLSYDASQYQMQSDEGIQALSRGDFDVDSQFVADSGRKRKGNMMIWIIVGGVVFVVLVVILIVSMVRRKR